ncbi:MAG: hypothetical protein ABIR63_07185 [Sphingomicrobium sp.]
MRGRLILIAAAALSTLTSASPATAEPAPADSPESGQPSSRPAEVVMASAERLPGTEASAEAAEAQDPATPAKRPRAGRVTTCRCGDPSQ